jgi:hypothetical protein
MVVEARNAASACNGTRLALDQTQCEAYARSASLKFTTGDSIGHGGCFLVRYNLHASNGESAARVIAWNTPTPDLEEKLMPHAAAARRLCLAPRPACGTRAPPPPAPLPSGLQHLRSMAAAPAPAAPVAPPLEEVLGAPLEVILLTSIGGGVIVLWLVVCCFCCCLQCLAEDEPEEDERDSYTSSRTADDIDEEIGFARADNSVAESSIDLNVLMRVAEESGSCSSLKAPPSPVLSPHGHAKPPPPPFAVIKGDVSGCATFQPFGRAAESPTTADPAPTTLGAPPGPQPLPAFPRISQRPRATSASRAGARTAADDEERPSEPSGARGSGRRISFAKISKQAKRAIRATIAPRSALADMTLSPRVSKLLRSGGGGGGGRFSVRVSEWIAGDGEQGVRIKGPAMRRLERKQREAREAAQERVSTRARSAAGPLWLAGSDVYLRPPLTTPALGLHQPFALFADSAGRGKALRGRRKKAGKDAFGAPLEGYAVGLCYGHRVPQLVIALWCALIKSGGLYVEGIFRLAPDASECAMVERSLARTGKLALGHPIIFAHLIKKFLRMLPGGLLSHVPLDTLRTLGAPPGEGRLGAKAATATALGCLDAAEGAMFQWLLRLIGLTQECKADNKMGVGNLAIVFGPAMLGASSSANQSPSSMVEELEKVELAANLLARCMGKD